MEIIIVKTVLKDLMIKEYSILITNMPLVELNPKILMEVAFPCSTVEDTKTTNH